MTEWLLLPENDRLLTLQQAEVRSGISTKALEKDWWVTLVLKAIFQSKFSQHLSFKGGTSLSKGWHLIERLSEDIDLAIDRHFLGYKDELSKSAVKRLKREACQFTSTVLKDTLQKELINLGVPESWLTVVADPIKENFPDTDPQVLRIKYPSLLDPVDYIGDSVKLEVSARSLNEPAISRPIQSLLDEYMPASWSGTPFMVPTVEPKRTFMEKAFLLHEEFLRPPDAIVFERMSRHLYDLERLMDTDHAEAALADRQYYTKIVEHRRKMIFKTGVNYDTHYPKTINFIPPDGIMAAYESDYALMREQMVYGENRKEFTAIIDRLRQLLEKFRRLEVGN